MLGLWSYAHWARTGLNKWWGLTTLWLALGLMSKQVLVTFPVICLLLDAWPLGRWIDPRLNRPTWQRARRLAIEKLPWLVLIAIGCWLAIEAQQEAKDARIYWPPLLRAANATLSYARYLSKTFWPVGLAVQYPFNAPESLTPVVLAAVLLAAITAAAAFASRKHPAVLAGWLWFGIVLLPMIGLIQVGKQSMADRYMYLPLIGLSIAVAWLVPAPRSRRALLGYAVAAAAVSGALIWRTAQQTAVWRDTWTLFSHAYAVDPTNDDALIQLGSMSLLDGRVDEALEYLSEGIAWDRRRWNACAEWAGPEYRNLYVRLNRRWAETLYTMAQAEVHRGKTDSAIRHLRDAIDADELHYEARRLLGQLLLDSGQPAAALHEFEELLKRQPGDPQAAAARDQARQRVPPDSPPRQE
jgi:tetratricopeptide (TPR) repeat protein